MFDRTALELYCRTAVQVREIILRDVVAMHPEYAEEVRDHQ